MSSSVLQPSELIFTNFINNNNIMLDNDYETIKNYYNYNFLDIKKDNKYFPYFNLFKKYYSFKNKINLIYYIIIIYYFDKNNLLNFIRFYTSKIYFYKFNTKHILKYNTIRNRSKNELISYLKKNIDVDYKNFLFFIYCIQNYI